MTLRETQQQLWKTVCSGKHPAFQNNLQLTGQESLANLAQMVGHCQSALEQGQTIQLQTQMENLLANLLIVMQVMNIDADAGLARASERIQNSDEFLTMVFSPGEAALYNMGLRQGVYPIASKEDYDTCLALAHGLGCQIIHQDSQQLALFS